MGRAGNPKVWFLSIGRWTSVMVGHLKWIPGKELPKCAGWTQRLPDLLQVMSTHITMEIITLGAVNHLVNGVALEISKWGHYAIKAFIYLVTRICDVYILHSSICWENDIPPPNKHNVWTFHLQSMYHIIHNFFVGIWFLQQWFWKERC